MLPPGVLPDWEDNAPWVQAMLIAYDQVRTDEKLKRDHDFLLNLLKASRG